MQVIPLLVIILITLSWGIEEKAADNARIAGCRRGSLLITDLDWMDIVLLWNLERETLLALYPKSLPSPAFYQQSAEFEGRATELNPKEICAPIDRYPTSLSPVRVRVRQSHLC